MKLQDVLSALHIEDAEETLAPEWERSLACLPVGTPDFLIPDHCTAYREYTGLPVELDPMLVETARRIAGDDALRTLVWHCQRLLFEELDYPAGSISRWPRLDASLGDLAGVFYLIVALTAVPRVRAVHATRGISDAVSRAGCSYLQQSVRLYREANAGRWGTIVRVLYWIRHHTAGRLFRLGRMEYMVRPFFSPLRAYRNMDTGEVLTLSEEGVEFNDEGFIFLPDWDDGSVWTSRLEDDGSHVTGNPICPDGRAVRETVQLPLDRWQLALKQGDPVLEMHIPAGGGMDLERCRDSMREALEFFPRYFPDRPFVGFGCTSWILNPEIETYYTPTSNMAAWQYELYLFPIPSNGKGGLFFVFGQDDVDLATAPRDTSLRRAMLDHLAAGRPLRNGGMFLLTEDFPQFGSQHYRTVCRSQRGSCGFTDG